MPPPPPSNPNAYGTLTLHVQPGYTLILVDGQRWPAPGTSDALVIRLSEGRHHVEISRPGFAPFVSDVDIKAGEATPLNVTLVRGS